MVIQRWELFLKMPCITADSLLQYFYDDIIPYPFWGDTTWFHVRNATIYDVRIKNIFFTVSNRARRLKENNA